MQSSLWKGYERIDDVFDGHDYVLVKPHTAANGNPWVWRAEFFSAFDSVDMDLLSKGWHIAYYRISNMYGCPESVELMKNFHCFITKEYNLSTKADIFGFSRGGLYSVNYTAKYPDDISVLYLDAPVLDIRSWPAGLGFGAGSPLEWAECKACYGLGDVMSIVNFHDNPIDKIETLVKNNIPVALCAGDSDETVPYVENGKILDEKYRRLGGDIITILKPGCNHHPHSISIPEPISNFIINHRK
ncbi:MAG: alpha/beta hydrolase family protein [Eubacteriales bacterium]